MLKINNLRQNYPLIAGIGIYFILLLVSFHFVYFWDTIQQVSKEGNWFYKTGFSSLLIPAHNHFNIVATGYHPPAMGIMTAFLWKIFAYHIGVSHVFSFFWAILFLYHSRKIINFLFPEKWQNWLFFLLIIESAVLTQFVISSPDFILLAAFVMSVRAILERKTVLLSIGLIFLCIVNMRGVFAGFLLFFAHFYLDYQRNNSSTLLTDRKKYSFRAFLRLLLPYLPVAVLLSAYYVYYFLKQGWFFGQNSPYAEHYILPQSVGFLMQHIFSFGLRLLENGRLVIWFLALYLGFYLIKNKIKLSLEQRFLALYFALIFGLYFLFVFITQMPFGQRYFMPMYFILTILVLHLLVKYWNSKKLKITFVVLYFFALTGHFWIYPEKMAQSWETTLMHLPYYELREEVFDYIDENHLNYSQIAAGFTLYGDRGYTELKNHGKVVTSDSDMTPQQKYFIYSNISNLPDETIDELKNKALWTPIKHFEKFPIFITVYEKNE